MRWDALFADLAAQQAALEAAERSGEAAERSRIEAGEIGLAERFAGALGQPVRVRCGADVAVTGTVRRVGAGWVLLEDAGRDIVVRVEAVVSVTGLVRSVASPSLVDARLGLRHVLRALARERAGVQVALTAGSVAAGTIDRVGADHIDLAVHAPGEARRRAEVRESVALPLSAICAVRRDR